MEKCKEQELIDICFALVATATDSSNQDFFHDKTMEEKMQWVSEKLKNCGYETEPIGASWGVLVSNKI